MKLTFLASVVLGIATHGAISAGLAQEEPLAIDSIKSTQGRVEIALKGGQGLAQLEEKDDLSQADFAPASDLTTETNIMKGALAAKKFFRARNAPQHDVSILRNTLAMLDNGRQTFRYDTFGDEAFWGGKMRLHEVVAGNDNGGIGPGLTPQAALALGLKVDSDALPESLKQQLQRGEVPLDKPETTLALLKLNAVVGVTGFFDSNGRLTSLGIQCAICHSTVDNSFTTGIGHRLDGWPNRDLDIGKIANTSPDVSALQAALGVDEQTVRTVLQSWGPGKFDAELILDGKTFRPDGKSAATLLPAAFGLAGVNLHTYTGWGSVTHWNAFVSNLEMHGQGTFYDPRLNDTNTFPLAAKNGYGNVRNAPDLITSKLAALHFYQLSIPAPPAPTTNYDATIALRGRTLFEGKAKCSTCHVPPLFTEPGWNMHTPAEIGIDDFQANRSPDKRYRTTPLKGLHARAKGGFYHDGRFATHMDVVNHYDSVLSLGLTDAEKTDLVEFLKSL